MTISVNVTDTPVGVSVSAVGASVSVTAASAAGVSVGVGQSGAGGPHAGTHSSGSSDPVSLDATQIVSGKLAAARLPTATGTAAGAVIVGSGLTVTADGVVSATGGGGGAVASVAGRTGTVTLTKTDVGLANVDNTSDAAKPISTATQTALDAKAPLNSPTFVGSVNAIPVGVPELPAEWPLWTGTNGVDETSSIRADGRGVFKSLSVTDGIAQTQINYADIVAWTANTNYTRGDLVSNGGVAYRRISSGSGGATFNAAQWRQLTPSVGSTAETLAAGNDPRFSDARTPTAHTHAAGDITSGTLARARIPGDLGTGSMTVSGSNSYGVSLDATARTLTQANTLAVMGGAVGIGTLTPLAAVGLEVAAPNATGSREILRVRNTTAGSTGYFDIGIGTAGYFQDQVIFIANGTIAMRILTSPAGQVIFPSSLRMPNGQQIIGDSNANAYIEMNNGAGQLSMSCVSAMSFQRLYVEVGRWDTNSVWNVGTGHASAASSGGSSVTGTQARVRFPGQVSTAAGQFAAAGDAQASRYHLRRTTTDATATTLFRDGSATRITIPAQSCWSFKIRLSAYNSTDGIGAAWTINGGIRRDNANGTALLGTPAVTQFADTAMAATTVAVTADDTNEALQVNVTGLAGKTIRWHAVVETSEVSAGTPS